jgi:nucleoside-diphosphate-sugar epimerase
MTPEDEQEVKNDQESAADDESVEDRRLFCFGLGYSALALARRLRDQGWAVAGTCRREEKRRQLVDEGFEAYLFNTGQPLESAKGILAGTTHILSSIAPDGGSEPVLDSHLEDLVTLETLQWIGYLSTTGVYGDTGGTPIDEGDRVNPTTERSRRRVLAEQRWLTLRHQRGLPVHLFRLAGIYGPHRSIFDRVRSGTAQRINKPGHKFSRIHVDDIATVLQASIEKPRGGAIYNVCDDRPAMPAHVTGYACKLLGKTLPQAISFEDAQKTMTPMAQSFWRDNRKVDNSRLKFELGVSLAYPDYKKGLESILEVEENEN